MLLVFTMLLQLAGPLLVRHAIDVDIPARDAPDTDALPQIFSGATVTLVAECAFFVGMLAVLAWVEWRLALVALALVAVVTVTSAVIVIAGARTQRVLRERTADLTAHVAERVQGLPAVQAFGREDAVVAEIDALGQAKHHAQWRAWCFEMAPHQIQSVVDLVARAAAIYLGGLWVLDGSTTLGTLVIAIDYMRRLHEPLAHATEQLGFVQRAIAAAGRVIALLDAPAPLTLVGAGFKPALTALSRLPRCVGWRRAGRRSRRT